MQSLLAWFQRILLTLGDFLNWFWNGLSRPKRKEWCAVFYFVGQGNGLRLPVSEPKGLDGKIREKIDALRLVSTEHGDTIHIVYRAVWKSEEPPVAEVMASSLWPPAAWGFFGYQPTSPTVNLTKDLPSFLKWAYQWCPAEHYALFFWGHSFGPAGLFSPGAGINIPSPLGLASLREALEGFHAERAVASHPQEHAYVTRSVEQTASAPVPVPGDSPIDRAKAILDWANTKLDVVLFEDCWMSTLETAYELQDEVRYVIASQSLLPIGSDDANFVWPYQDLLGALAAGAVDWQDLLAARILAFYQHSPSTFYSEKSEANDPPALRTVPIALLDLAAVPAITAPLRAFVSAMQNQLKPTRGKNIVEGGRIFSDNGPNGVWAGDAALVDVVRLCLNMEAQVSDVTLAATALELRRALWHDVGDPQTLERSLIRWRGEAVPCHPRVGGAEMPPLQFKGVSVLYWPPGGPEDECITLSLDSAFYNSLRFSRDVKKWPALEQQKP